MDGSDLRRREVDRTQRIPMSLQKRVPRRSSFPFRRGFDAVCFQDVANGLVADLMSDIGECFLNIVRETEGFDFVGRQFKRLSPIKFLVWPCRSSIRMHLEALAQLFRNHALPVGVQIQTANAEVLGISRTV